MVPDGAVSQFKNRFALSNIGRPYFIHYNLADVDWSFFATQHGKGPVDGAGYCQEGSVEKKDIAETGTSQHS